MARDRRALPLQVRDGLRQYLAREGLNPGDKLPTEEELCARFEVSRATLREALRLLEQDGVLEVRQGNGRYMSALPNVERPITRLEGMTELLQSMGHHVTDRVLGVASRPATETEATALHCPAGTEVIEVRRVRLQDTEPLTYSAVVLPRRLFPGPVSQYDWSLPLHQLLDAIGHRTAASNTQIRAASLPRDVARGTGLPASIPYLLLVQTIVSRDGVFLMHAQDYMRGDHFSYDVRRKRE